MSRRRILLRVATTIAGMVEALALGASPAEQVSQFDVNGNGQIDNPAEVYLGLYHREHPDKTDLARLRLDTKVPERILNAEGLGKGYQEFLKQYGTKISYRFAEIDPTIFATEERVDVGRTLEQPQKQPSSWKPSWRIRRDASQLSAAPADLKGGASFGDVFDQSALFSYGRNFNTDIDQWTARGIVAYSATRNDNPEGALRSLGLDLSVAFDKVNTGGSSTDEVDTLDFGAGLATNWRIPSNPFRFSGLTTALTAHWSTDFDLEKRVVGGTLEMTPTFSLPGYETVDALLGTYQIARLNELGRPETRSFVDFRWWISLHAEAGQVLDAQREPGLLGYKGFARLGASANLKLEPFPEALEHRLNLYASYLHYEAVTTRTPSSHLFRTSLQYLLPLAGGTRNPQNDLGSESKDKITLSLKIEYQNGEIPFVQEKDNSILIGLGVVL